MTEFDQPTAPAEPPKLGRPPLPATARRDTRIMVRLTALEAQIIRAQARRLAMAPSAYLRMRGLE